MATIIWRGDAQAVPQVSRINISALPSLTQSCTLTINGKDIRVESTSSTTTLALYKAAVAAAIGQYDNDIPEFAEVSAEVDGTNLDVTGPINGAPFTMTGSCTDGGVTFSISTPTSPSGPNWASVADNWSTGSVPGTGDTVIFENNAVDVLYGLDAITGDTLTKLAIKASYTGQIGLPAFNPNGYWEYRDTQLQLGATTVIIGEGDGAGVTRCNLDLEAVQSEVIVLRTGVATDPAIGSVSIVGTHASNVVRVVRGNVGIATHKHTDAATVATLELSYIDNQASDAQAIVGAGTTLTTIKCWGGDSQVFCDFTSLEQDGGLITLNDGVSPSGSVDILSGRCLYLSSGTLTQGYVSDGGTLEFGKYDTRTVTNLTVYAGATVIDEFQTVTWSNAIVLTRCSLAEVDLQLGTGLSLLPS